MTSFRLPRQESREPGFILGISPHFTFTPNHSETASANFDLLFTHMTPQMIATTTIIKPRATIDGLPLPSAKLHAIETATKNGASTSVNWLLRSNCADARSPIRGTPNLVKRGPRH